MKKRIIIFICAVLLSVSVSFAWIIDSVQNYERNKVEFSYYDQNDVIRVVSLEGIEVEIYTYSYDENGDYIKDEDGNPVITLVDSNDTFSLTDMYPGQSLRFKIRFYNTSDEDKVVSLSMSGIECSDGILDYLYFSSWAGDGYTYDSERTYNVDPEDRPAWQMKKLSDMKRSNGKSANIYKQLFVPMTTDEEGRLQFVDLECRFRVDTDGDTPKDASFSVRCFTVST